MIKFFSVNNVKKILLSTLLFNIIFFKTPVEIFYFNRPDFQNFTFILIPSTIIFFLSLLFFKKIYLNKKIFNIFLAVSIYLILSKIFVPLNIDELEGNLDKPIELKYSVLYEVIILLFSFYLIKFFEKKFFINFLTVLALIIFLNTSYYFSRSVASIIKHQYNYFGVFDDNKKIINLKNNNPNIYLITFDAFSSYALEKMFKDEPEYMKVFNDFEFFINNSSNYSSTSLSVPSFLTGSLYNFDMKLSVWKDIYRKEGLISELINKKYEVWQYVQSSSMQHKDVMLGTTNVDLLLDNSVTSLIIELYDFVLLRISPQFLHQEIYNNGSGLISKLLNRFNKKSNVIPGEHFRALGSKLLFEKIIEDEKNRSQKGIFLHGHVYIPHGPYVLDKNAEYDPTPYDGVTGVERYHEQSKGVVFLINNFLEELKSQGKFENSLIIFNADHGSWEIGLQELPKKYLDRKISLDDNLRQLPGSYVFNQSKSILLVKKPYQFSNSPLKVNTSKTQLLDIYPTIKKFAGYQLSNNYNNNMLSLLEKLPNDRDIKYYVGYKQRKSPNHQWTTIEKQSGGNLDLFEISNKNFMIKKDRIYAEW